MHFIAGPVQTGYMGHLGRATYTIASTRGTACTVYLFFSPKISFQFKPAKFYIFQIETDCKLKAVSVAIIFPLIKLFLVLATLF